MTDERNNKSSAGPLVVLTILVVLPLLLDLITGLVVPSANRIYKLSRVIIVYELLILPFYLYYLIKKYFFTELKKEINKLKPK
ncbi:MAG: hypothetical protein J0H92_03900 [Sphingobacteriales bacterium]|nr:hypothetical protein [Sphingobacteriales bacterium]NCT77046.1 hypothetical protein [Chitinophagaceae bacterium]OJW32837.1 MAG: hypothetical protein BGO54_21015 [Sphingobacteriales bacterium 46-32]